MRNLFKTIGSFFTKKVKTPEEIKREVVVETLFPNTDEKSLNVGDRDKFDKLVSGIAKGTFIVDKHLADQARSKEEQFEERVIEDIRLLIKKHYADETHELREEIKSLEGHLRDKERELATLQSIKEVMA